MSKSEINRSFINQTCENFVSAFTGCGGTFFSLLMMAGMIVFGTAGMMAGMSLFRPAGFMMPQHFLPGLIEVCFQTAAKSRNNRQGHKNENGRGI